MQIRMLAHAMVLSLSLYNHTRVLSILVSLILSGLA